MERELEVAVACTEMTHKIGVWRGLPIPFGLLRRLPVSIPKEFAAAFGKTESQLDRIAQILSQNGTCFI